MASLLLSWADVCLDVLPASTDDSLEADLARIKYYRNSIYGHVNENMEISGDKFSVLWREISEALVRIAGQMSPAKAKEWQNAIDTFSKDAITEEDKRNEQELQHWYQNDTELKEYVEKVDSSVKHLEKYLKHEVQEQAQDIKDELGRKIQSTAQEVQHSRQEIQHLSQEVQHLRQEVRHKSHDIKDELAQEVECFGQEFLVGVQDMKDQFKLGGQPNPSAGGQLVDLFLYILSKVLFL